MIEEVLKSISGVQIFPIIGLFIFLAGFAMVIAATWRMKKSDVDYVSRLPLDDGIVTVTAETETGDERSGKGNN